jgi:hypothetical protein
VAFLAAAYRDGLRGAADAIGIHVYPGVYPIVVDLRARIALARAVKQRAGDPTPFWLTEYGVSTGAAGGGDYHPRLTEAEQALALPAMDRAVRAMSDIPVALFFRLRDTPPPGNGFNNGIGIFRIDGTAKPAVATVAAELAHPGAQPAVRLHTWITTARVMLGQPVVLHVATWHGSGGAAGPVTYHWDINENGFDETTSGVRPSIMRVFRRRGVHVIDVDGRDLIDAGTGVVRFTVH